MSTLWQEITREAKGDPQGDPEQIAERLLRRVGKQQLKELLANEIKAAQRTLTREVETRAFHKLMTDSSLGVLSEQARTRVALSPLFGERFRLGDGIVVTWGEATVAQHRLRVAMLQRQRTALDETIERHLEAIRRCEEARVQRLADIPIEQAG